MNNLIKDLRKMVNSELKITSGGKTFSSDENSSYQFKYDFENFTLYTSSILEKSLINLLAYIINDELEKKSNHHYLIDVIAGKNLNYDLVKKNDYYLILISSSNPDDVAKLLNNYLDNHDISFIYKQENIILVGSENIYEDVKKLNSLLQAELMIKIKLTYSNKISDLSKLRSNYLKLKELNKLSNIFATKNNVVSINDFELERLILNLNQSISSEYLKENSFVFDLDQEDKNMIEALIDNNLNIAQTSRSLYVHRNTLLYRIEKFKNHFSYDLLNFNDVLKIKLLLILAEITNYNNR